MYCLTNRAHVTDESSLLVKSVKVADEGTYVCEAENSVGMISSEVTLTVHCKCFFFQMQLNQIKTLYKCKVHIIVKIVFFNSAFRE